MKRQILFFGFIGICVAGVIGSMLYEQGTGGGRAKTRMLAIASRSKKPSVVTAKASTDPARRRKAILENLKELDQRKAKSGLSLEERIVQAGLSVPVPAFIFGCLGVGAVVAVVVFIYFSDYLYAAGGFVLGGAGVPFWVLSFLRKRRMAKMVELFPAAIEVIVRGVKAGLPLGDCFRVIAIDGQEPLKEEFRLIVEGDAVGLSLSESVERFALRVPTTEMTFFAIVISIQQKAGGNLSEALSNLANVLRSRKLMKEKARAMASEAKGSAMIIGSLPFIMGGIVYFVNPSYIMTLFTTSQGKLVLLVAAIWMSIGIFVMKKLIDIDV